MLQLFINLTPWLHTIHALSLLPGPSSCKTYEELFPADTIQWQVSFSSMLACCSLQCGYEVCNRLYLDCLFAVNGNGEQYGQVQLVPHFNSVEKTFQVSGQHMQELYGLLHTLKLAPHNVQPCM